MKEKYTSPTLELLCFAPVQKLANDSEIDFGDLTNPGSGLVPNTSTGLEDVIVPVKPGN